MEQKIIYCEYGCGQEAKFQTKPGKNICAKSCNSCPVNKKKNSDKKLLAYKEGTKCGWKKNYKPWNKDLTKETDERVNNYSKTIKEKIKNGFVPAHTKWTKSDEGRKRLSEARSDYLQNHSHQCNWFIVNNGKKDVRVQGTWEKRFAEYLNNNNIKWDRFKIHFDNNIHIYTPDFYLPDYNLFIEVKGWMRDRDIIKMHKVCEENYVDIRLVDSKKLLRNLEKNEINIEKLEKFVDKYPIILNPIRNN